MPYLGKGANTGGGPHDENVVKKLTRSFQGLNRNITSDNWFTSISLAKQLQQQTYRRTTVGTLQANK